jgi:hypothetical protein
MAPARDFAAMVTIGRKLERLFATIDLKKRLEICELLKATFAAGAQPEEAVSLFFQNAQDEVGA